MNPNMASSPTPKTRPGRVLAWALVGLLVSAGLAGLAAAEPQERPQRDREWAQKRADHGFTLRLNGTLTTRDNQTYPIEIEGRGLARVMGEDGNLTLFKGRAKLHLRVLDENGTALREGDLFAQVRAKCNEDGECRWQFQSVGKKARTLARISVHGEADKDPDGGWDLTGDGRMVIKPQDGRAHAAKVSVTGDLVRTAA